ncbi:hypothetical protein Ae201684P_007125 [Aphanomyces euteiches]|uniref:Cyclin C-terminal domain-containing protein n=1 Tax=Aphanomyces euteiches TaxID=100861 RepID=A0A6G0X967_9STRA|nr:hypothetical protein Ae201684_007559 [Aphanomyces euteiches]KAH9100934.1 hypothetical protein Ae201684P_007125 [Aphanomyces euteiches]
MYSGLYQANEFRLADTKMGHEMTRNAIELDFDMVRSYRLREVEKSYSVRGYMPSLTSAEWSTFHVSRARLVHRIVGVASSLALKRETCHLACSYLTRVSLINLLQRGQMYPTHPFNVKTPEHPNVLFVAASIVIASKIEEVNPPSIQDILEAVQRESGEYVDTPQRKRANSKTKTAKKSKPKQSIYTTKEEVVAEEEAMIKLLDWKLYPATAVSWLLMTIEGLGLYREPVQNSPCYVGYGHEYEVFDSKNETRVRECERANVFHLASNLLDVSLLDSNLLHFLPSMMAAASLFLMAPGHNLYALSHFLQLKPEDVWDCVSWIQQYLPYAASPLPFSVHSTVQSKFNKIPKEDRYAVQVASTTIAYNSIFMFPLAAQQPQQPVCDDPQYEPEREREILLPPLYQCIVPDKYTSINNNFGYFS